MAAPPLVPPDPPLADELVVLRPPAAADVDQITAACQDPAIQRFIPLPRPYRRSDATAYVERTAREWRAGTKAAFTIVARGTDEPPSPGPSSPEPSSPESPGDAPPGSVEAVLGVVNLAIAGSVGNAGYWVVPGCRGLGVARRALRLVTSWAFEQLGLGVVILEIREENEASRAVARAAGYHRSGRLDVNTATGKTGGLIYSRLATDA